MKQTARYENALHGWVWWTLIATFVWGWTLAPSPGLARTVSEAVKQRLAASGLEAADLDTSHTATLHDGVIRIVSLREVVLETLSYNLDLDIARLDRGIVTDEIQSALGIYDPVLAMQASRTRTDRPSATQPVSFGTFTIDNKTHVNHDRFEAGVSQLTPLGGLFELSYTDSNTNVLDSSRTSMVNPFYEHQVKLAAVQPLLKNFGPTVTNASIRIARHRDEIARHAILSHIDNQVARAMQTYWDLVFAIENLSVQRLFLKQARDLLRINTAKFETGVLAHTDVLQAKAQVALGQERVILAQAAIHDVQDQLRRLMNPRREPSEWDEPLVPEDIPTPKPVALDDETAVREALDNRPEIRQLLTGIDIARIGRDVARRQKLPELNLFGEYALHGAGDTNRNGWKSLEHNDFASYQFGVQMRYPLLNRKARHDYKRSLKEIDKTEMQLQNLESGVVLEVRAALRRVRTSLQRIAATETAVESETAKLDAQLRRYDVGMATSFEVLTFQQDLAAARVSHLSALVDHNKALIELDRACARIRDRLLALGIPVEFLGDHATTTRPE